MAMKDGRRALEKANRSPVTVKNGRRERWRSIGSPRAAKDGRREQARSICSPMEMKEGGREQRRSVRSPIGYRTLWESATEASRKALFLQLVMDDQSSKQLIYLPSVWYVHAEMELPPKPASLAVSLSKGYQSRMVHTRPSTFFTDPF